MRVYGYNGQKLLISDDHTTRQIMQLLLSQDGKYCSQVKDFTDGLQGESTYDACKAIWTSLKRDVKYIADDESMQNLKSPARLVYDGFGDCKSYSLAIACCLRNLGIPYAYRFVSFTNDRTPTHVYIVAAPGTKDECIIDCVLNYFDYEKPYRHKIDKKMALSMLTGIDNNSSELSYGTKVMRTLANRKNGRGSMNGFLQDLASGKVYKALTVDTQEPGVVDSNKQKADIINQFGILTNLQAQKVAAAATVKQSYADRKAAVDAIQAKQNVAMAAVVNDVIAKVSDDKRTADFTNIVNTALIGLTSAAVSAAATPAAGKATAALLELSINPAVPPSNQANIAALKQFTASAFPFYTKAQVNNGAPAKQIALSPATISTINNTNFAAKTNPNEVIIAQPVTKTATPKTNTGSGGSGGTWVQPSGTDGGTASTPMSTGQKIGIGVALASLALFIANETGAIKLSKIFK